MPYVMVPRGTGYVVRNTATGRTFSSSPLSKGAAKKQLRAVSAAADHWALSRRRRYRRMLGRGWWDDVKGFFNKAYDATIGKIPVIGDIGRKVAGVVFNPVNTLGNMAQKVTEGDFKGVASEAVAGVKRAVEGPNIAQIVTKGTPLEGLANTATDIIYDTVRLPGVPISLADARDAALAATSVAEKALGAPDAVGGAPDAVGGGWFLNAARAARKYDEDRIRGWKLAASQPASPTAPAAPAAPIVGSGWEGWA